MPVPLPAPRGSLHTWFWLIAAALLAAGGLALLVWRVPAEPLSGDGGSYVEFVRSHFQHHAALWHMRRLLGPWIVYALPLEPLNGYFVLTLTSLFVTALLTWAAARALGLSGARACAGVGLLFGTWAVAPYIREYALVDPLAWAFVAAVWLMLVRRQWLWAAALGAGGVLAKEMVAVAALAAGVAAWHPLLSLRGICRAALVAAPAWLVVAVLVVLIADPGNAQAIGVGEYISDWVTKGLGSLGPVRVAYLVFASHGALWLLLPVGLTRLPSHVQRATVVLVGVALLLPIVGTPERMLAVAFPALITAALAATREWSALRLATFTVGCALFVGRAGGNAFPAVLAWGGLAVALALALPSYLPVHRWLSRSRGRAPARSVGEGAGAL